MEQIKYAVLERSGGISIIPNEPAGGSGNGRPRAAEQATASETARR
jgi:hypothetical protein